MARYGPDYVPQEVRYLREHGPTPRSEMVEEGFQPQGRYKSHDVRRLAVGKSGGATESGIGGRVDQIHYLPEHDLEDVVRAFVDANPSILDRRKRDAARFFGKDSRAMKDAWHAVVDEFADQMVDPVRYSPYDETEEIEETDEAETDGEEQAWISKGADDSASTEVYHTDTDCKSFPVEARPLTAEDRRRGVRACGYCSETECPFCDNELPGRVGLAKHIGNCPGVGN